MNRGGNSGSRKVSVMEKGSFTLGMEDGTTDVERLLVEPQAVHVSIDSICCFDEKISENAMYMEEFSGNFGRARTCIGQQGKDVLSARVLDVIPSEVEVGYFQDQNEFCSMEEEYLLGVELSESITNLDGGSILHSSVSDCPILSSSATNTPWKVNQSRIMGGPECNNIPSHHECNALVENSLKLPSLSTSRNIGNFYDFSSCSFQDILSNEIDRSMCPMGEMNNSFKNGKDEDYGMMIQGIESNRFQGDDSLPIISVQASDTETFPMQKRSRKPTQRYIDELTDTVSRYSKKKRKVSSSTSEEKCVGVLVNKKCHMESRAMRLPEEETSIIAIQVPFGSLVHKECPKNNACDIEHSLESESLITGGTPPDKKKVGEVGITAVHMKTRDRDRVAGQKKKIDFVNEDHLKKRTVTVARQKKSGNWIIGVSPKKRDNSVTSVNQKKDDSQMSARQKKNVECLTLESHEEVSGRRKHHRLWTISEVRKLIDGVSQFGVGSWSRIKKLFFPTSAHRTSVDLKDKWRNLLKASGIQDQSNQQGEKKRNVPWRPLPKSILRHVCELAAMYPYPKDRKPKSLHIRHDDSPDKSTDKSADITLSNYRRILRSINGN